MHVSLSEIASTVTKAGQSVGLAIGQAEDAGRAARFAAECGLAPLAAYADALGRLDRGEASGPAGDLPPGELQAEDPEKPLSALLAGPSACDLAVAAAEGVGGAAPVTLADVDAPALLLFQAMLASRYLGPGFRLTCACAGEAHLDIACRASALSMPWQDRPAALHKPCPALRVSRLAAGEEAGLIPHHSEEALSDGIAVEDRVWRQLTALAKRQLVESSETSLQQGAGAGVVDRD